MNNTEKDLLSSYLLAFDEINALTSTSYLTADSGDIARRVNQIVGDILSMLINAYRLGIEHASKMLGEEIPIRIDVMESVIYEVINGETFADRVYDHVSENDLQGLQVLAESEWHRVYSASAQWAAGYVQDSMGLGVIKIWKTVGDEKVRYTHRNLDGVSVAVDEEFYTCDYDHASSPGNFTKAENNVNCRCWIVYRIDVTQV